MASPSPELLISHHRQAVGAPTSALLPVSLPHTWLCIPHAALGQALCLLTGWATPAPLSAPSESGPPSEVLFRHAWDNYHSSAACLNCDSRLVDNLTVAVQRYCGPSFTMRHLFNSVCSTFLCCVLIFLEYDAVLKYRIKCFNEIWIDFFSLNQQDN